MAWKLQLRSRNEYYRFFVNWKQNFITDHIHFMMSYLYDKCQVSYCNHRTVSFFYWMMRYATTQLNFTTMANLQYEPFSSKESRTNHIKMYVRNVIPSYRKTVWAIIGSASQGTELNFQMSQWLALIEMCLCDWDAVYYFSEPEGRYRSIKVSRKGTKG